MKLKKNQNLKGGENALFSRLGETEHDNSNEWGG